MRQKDEVWMKATLSVVILYEDAQTREKAVKFCDQLVERFWANCEFRLTWMDFSALHDPNAARDAHAKARGADVIVFATRPEGPVPGVVTDWVERCLANRTDREGTLAGLIESSTILTGWAAEKHAWLRSVAHRAGMDYLTDVPHDIAKPIPDSLESFSERAQQVTSVLDEILHKPIHPPSLP
jgi:hypothetical protein